MILSKLDRLLQHLIQSITAISKKYNGETSTIVHFSLNVNTDAK